MRSCDETFTRPHVRHDQFLRNFGESANVSNVCPLSQDRILLFLHTFFSRYARIVRWPASCEAEEEAMSASYAAPMHTRMPNRPAEKSDHGPRQEIQSCSNILLRWSWLRSRPCGFHRQRLKLRGP